MRGRGCVESGSEDCLGTRGGLKVKKYRFDVAARRECARQRDRHATAAAFLSGFLLIGLANMQSLASRTASGEGGHAASA